ncbi:MAG: hypothetical protein ABF976_10300 [Acetobacter syzygii]|uniref:hypothetical protein n=1 Tax=Acetobacter syzygii TaxID=146476 RepID=UPI0039EAD427
MTSPAVWSDAWARATAAAKAGGTAVLDPTDDIGSVPAGPYWVMETDTGLSDRMGAGEPVNQETGTIWLHLMVAKGTGTPAALALRISMSNAFRAAAALSGLSYFEQHFDPPSLSTDGTRYRFSLGIAYEFQNLPPQTGGT